MRGDVDEPALDCVEALRWDAGHGAGIVHAEEDGAAGGVRERNQLAREVLGVGGQDAAVAETEGLEFGQTVLSGAELVQNPISRVEHRGHVQMCRLPCARGSRTTVSLPSPALDAGRPPPRAGDPDPRAKNRDEDIVTLGAQPFGQPSARVVIDEELHRLSTETAASVSSAIAACA